MIHQVEFFPEAEQAIQEVVRFLEERKKGRGSDLLVSISDAVELIAEYPKSTPIRYRTFRAKPLRDFPYLLIYEIIDGADSASQWIAIEDFVHQSSNWLPT